MRIALVLVTVGAVLAGCTDAPSDAQFSDAFKSNVKVGILALQSDFSDLEPQTRERNGQCYKLVQQLLWEPVDDAQHQYLSDKLTAALAKSDTFKMYDRWVVFFAQDYILEHPPEDPSFLKALARKIDNARQVDSPDLYRTVYSSLTVGFILRAVTYPEGVSTDDDVVDYQQWVRLQAWLDEHGKDLIYDTDLGRYRPRDQIPTVREIPETPEG